MKTIEKKVIPRCWKSWENIIKKNAHVDLNVLFIEKFDEEHRKLETEIKNIIFLKVCR